MASFKQRNSAITEDLERQEVERENLWKRLQAARAEGDQLRALAQRSTDEDLSASSAASSPRAIATIEVDVATAGVVEGDGRGAATAADPEGGRRAAAHVGDGAREVATTRSCVTLVCNSLLYLG